MNRELQTMNQQNKLALWAGRISECRSSGQKVKVWALAPEREHIEDFVIACKEENGLLVYSHLIDRESATRRETESFLGRVYQGSVSMMLSALTQKQALPQKEVDQLYALLEEMEGNSHD